MNIGVAMLKWRLRVFFQNGKHIYSSYIYTGKPTVQSVKQVSVLIEKNLIYQKYPKSTVLTSVTYVEF